MSGPVRVLSYAVVLVLTALLCVWGAFLVPLHVGRLALPVGVLLALATVPLCRAGGDLLGRRAGAAVPGVLWVFVAMLLSGARREGDVVVPGSARGIAFLVLGTLGAAVTIGSWRPGRESAGPG